LLSSHNYNINNINVKDCKSMIDNDLQKRNPCARKCLIVKDLYVMQFEQKEAEGFALRLC